MAPKQVEVVAEEEKERLFTVEEMCTLMKVDRRTLTDWVQYRKIPFVRLDGKYIRFRLSDISGWIGKQQRSHKRKFTFQ